MAVRYRAGIDQTSGQTLVGMDHVNQSLVKILTTLPFELVMLLATRALSIASCPSMGRAISAFAPPD